MGNESAELNPLTSQMGRLRFHKGIQGTLTGKWVLAGRNPSVGSQGGVFVGFCDGERTLQQESGSAAYERWPPANCSASCPPHSISVKWG